MRGLRVVASGAVLAAVAGATLAATNLSPSALEPASTGGLELVDRALGKLSTHRRVLLVGAHPDDEDNSLLTWVSRGLGGEAAYLSMSRGEGGQNLIGPELGVGLGAIRTGELMAARRVEGTRQYFTRAFDFGYTRSLDETFERWPREVLQRDAVRAVRSFKPQLIVAIFPADTRGGHGQHQASAVIARDLFDLAGDAESFPELSDEGLSAWRPLVLYRRSWRRGGESSGLLFEMGAIDPLTGKSLLQTAAESRSLHRSQDMGRTQPLGPYSAGLVWIAGGVGPEATDPFAGVDTRLAAIAATVADAPVRAAVVASLDRVETLARSTRRILSPTALEDAVPPLAEIVGLLADVGARLSAVEAHSAASLVAEKHGVAQVALAAAAGVVLDATTDSELAAPGGHFDVSVELWRAGSTPVEVKAVELLLEMGGEVKRLEASEIDTSASLVKASLRVAVERGAAPTVPYFLRRPRRDDLYDWRSVPAEALGQPLQPPPLRVRVALEIGGQTVELEREVVYRYGDQAVGEVRRPVRVVPVLEVSVEPGLVVSPVGATERRSLEVSVRSNVERPVSGRVELWVGGSAEPAASLPFSIAEPRGQATHRYRQPLPDDLEPGSYPVRVVATLDSGERFTFAYPLTEYPHVRPMAVPRPARVDVRALDLELPDLSRVGYVRGASDRVPEILGTLDFPLELLAAEDLETVDLSGFDAIVIGSRAYEAEPALARGNARLLDYVRGGGLVVVQYQQYQFARGEFAPYPLDISRPHGRVTDEHSAVTILLPEHPVFHRPNAIGEADWEGWVQERGLYFAGEWDDRYVAPLELADAGRAAERGSLLIAGVGDGTWVYTGLSFFRELPAGVPGAIRLFANLLGLAAGPPPGEGE